ncbi:response regulator [Candidatus Micrarchaeota archaeon]|nr:response regulator [Candidatus Micrarchaeota archaeon]
MMEREREAGKPRVLLVEDDGPVRRLTKILLSKDFDVHEAADGNEARQHLDAGKAFHVVLSDISYPYGNAEALLEHMHNHEFEPHRRVPLILMTAGHNEDRETLMDQEKKRGRSVQAIDKPFEPAELIKLVKTAVEKGPNPQ